MRKKLRKVIKNGQNNLQVRPTLIYPGTNIDIGKSPQMEQESIQLQNINRSASNEVRSLNINSDEKAQI